MDIFIFSTSYIDSYGNDVFLNRELQYVMLYTWWIYIMCTILIIAQFFHPFIISTSSSCSAIKTKQKVSFTGSLSIFIHIFFDKFIPLEFFSRDNSSHPSSSSSSQHKCLSQLHHNWKFLLSAMLSLPPRFFFVIVHITSIKDPWESVASSISNKWQIKLWLD